MNLAIFLENNKKLKPNCLTEIADINNTYETRIFKRIIYFV